MSMAQELQHRSASERSMSTDRDWRTVFRRYARLLMRSPSIPELGNAKGLPMPSTPDALQGLSQRRRNRC